MSTAGFDLAEAYVLRERHREKVKMEQEQTEQAKSGTAESETVKSSCCLFWWLNKVHANKISAAQNPEVGS